jgi:hypothetical protein
MKPGKLVARRKADCLSVRYEPSVTSGVAEGGGYCLFIFVVLFVYIFKV